MTRTLKEPDIRRAEILDAAQALIFTKGYEDMSIQDILDRLQISKGAFYHYFDSKQALLDALIERMQADAQRVIGPISADPDLPALEKMRRVLLTANRWKVAQKDYLMALVRTWYTDQNAIVRQKITARMLKESGSLITDVIQQGVREGVFKAAYPEFIGEIAMGLMIALGDRYAEILLSGETQSVNMERVRCISAAYSEAIERVLGAPPGSIEVIDTGSLEQWFIKSGASA
jgi:TetR/AcrR family transcriptional regulator, transcriptional repressor for nem operon